MARDAVVERKKVGFYVVAPPYFLVFACVGAASQRERLLIMNSKMRRRSTIKGMPRANIRCMHTVSRRGRVYVADRSVPFPVRFFFLCIPFFAVEMKVCKSDWEFGCSWWYAYAYIRRKTRAMPVVHVFFNVWAGLKLRDGFFSRGAEMVKWA